jgi:hypothetical protein
MPKRDKKKPKVDFLSLLACKVFCKLSWKKWSAVRKASNVPVYRNEIQSAATFLDFQHAIPMYSCTGAYLSPIPLLTDILTEYTTCGAIFPHPSKPTNVIWVKLAIDNTKVFYTKVEGYYLSLLDVVKCQSVKHQVILALSRTLEHNDEMQRVAAESNMQELVTAASNFTFFFNNVLHPLILFLTLDWTCHRNWT